MAGAVCSSRPLVPFLSPNPQRSGLRCSKIMKERRSEDGRHGRRGRRGRRAGFWVLGPTCCTMSRKWRRSDGRSLNQPCTRRNCDSRGCPLANYCASVPSLRQFPMPQGGRKGGRRRVLLPPRFSALSTNYRIWYGMASPVL